MIWMAVTPAMGRAQTVTALKAPKAPLVATPTDLVGPPDSGRFGTAVTALPNGNIVVTDLYFSVISPFPMFSVGAIYLYNGATGALISMLTGSNSYDLIGIYGVTVLSNGNYVIRSGFWNGGKRGGDVGQRHNRREWRRLCGQQPCRHLAGGPVGQLPYNTTYERQLCREHAELAEWHDPLRGRGDVGQWLDGRERHHLCQQ
jgi:hypothetical protein